MHPRARLEELLLHPVRFSIVALLHHVERADFSVVRDEVEVSDSVLSRQIAMLEDAGLLDVLKSFVGKRPHTALRLTRRGRDAFAGHLDALRAIVDAQPASRPDDATRHAAGPGPRRTRS